MGQVASEIHRGGPWPEGAEMLAVAEGRRCGE